MEHIGLNAVGVIEQFREVCRAVTITARTAAHGWTERGTAMKLIDPDELERVLRPILKDESCPLHIAAEIDMNLDLMPTVDAVPVVHGRWETVEDWDGDEHYQCSECKAEYVLIDGTPEDNDYLFCPHCGAKMDGDDNG